MTIINPSDGAAQFAVKLRDIERRLSNMETARQTQHSTIAGGRVQVIDEDGNVVAELGQLEDTGRHAVRTKDPATGENVTVLGELIMYEAGGTGNFVEDTGVLVQDANGVDVLAVTRDRGLIKPVQQFGWRTPNNAVAVTSATFATQYQSVPAWWPTTALYCSVAVAADAATTGEVRLQLVHDTLGTLNSSAITIAAGSNEYRTFQWDLAGLGVDIGDPFLLNVQARRTGGAGNVWVYEPLPLRSWDTYSMGADTDGVV